jgi:hypothetical protein
VPSLTHSDPAPSELSDPTLYSWVKYEINTGQRIAPCVAGVHTQVILATSYGTEDFATRRYDLKGSMLFLVCTYALYLRVSVGVA